MEAITFTQKGKVAFKPIPEPELHDDEVLVRVEASGICHTDIDILHGRYGSSSFPLVPGHEYSGEVVAKGDAVTRFDVGSRVVIDPNFHCGKCKPCHRKQFNLCEGLGAYGVTKNGGFAELSAVHQDNVINIGTTPYHIASLSEPVGCVLNGLDAVETQGVDNALVFGCGPIGMLMALAMRTRGISEITMVDVDENRLALAESFRFNGVMANSDELAKYITEIDLVVDATGVSKVAESSIQYVANGGRILFFGVCPPDARIKISPFEIFRRQIRIAGAHSLNHNIPEAIEVINSIGPDIEKLISHRLPLSEIAGFLDHDRPAGSLKIMAVSQS